MPTSVGGGPGRRTYKPGSPEWEEAVRNQLEALRGLIGETGEIPQENLGQVMGLTDALTAAETEDPEAFKAIWTEAYGPVAGAGNAAEEALAGLEQYLSGLSGPTLTRRTVEATVEEREAQKLRTTYFFETPTPEEFLDNYTASLATHVGELARSGAISRQTAMAFMDNPEWALNEYLAMLGEKAARGEDIYKVVGMGAQPIKLGERMGQRTGVAETAATTKEHQEAREAVTRLVEAGGGTVTPEISQTIEDFLTKQTGYRTTAETEAVYQRPALASVYKTSFLDFLKERFPAKSMELYYQGFKGKRRAETAFALGPPAILPRRVV